MFYKHLSNKKHLLGQAAEPICSGFCHVRNFTYLSVAFKNK